MPQTLRNPFPILLFIIYLEHYVPVSDLVGTAWRIIDSGEVSPAYSAAADEAILDARIREEVPDTLHFYVRDRPTVSIGYNTQLESSVDMHELKERNVEVVRRVSGGSAIYTDPGQLIFSLVVGSSLLPSDINRSYSVACSAVIAGIATLGIVAEHKPINDIVVNGSKISGSAQLRRGSAVLHHGTILVDADIEAIESVIGPGGGAKSSVARKKMTTLGAVLGFIPDMKSVKDSIARGIATSFGVSILPGDLTAGEKKDILRLISEKYGSTSWNYGR